MSLGGPIVPDIQSVLPSRMTGGQEIGREICPASRKHDPAGNGNGCHASPKERELESVAIVSGVIKFVHVPAY